MAYKIVQACKIGKENIKRLDNTTDTYSAPSSPSNSYSKFNENTDITSKESLTAETHSRTIFSLDNKPSVIIHNKYASNRFRKDVFISNVSVDGDAQSFKTPI